MAQMKEAWPQHHQPEDNANPDGDLEDAATDDGSDPSSGGGPGSSDGVHAADTDPYAVYPLEYDLECIMPESSDEEDDEDLRNHLQEHVPSMKVVEEDAAPRNEEPVPAMKVVEDNADPRNEDHPVKVVEDDAASRNEEPVRARNVVEDNAGPRNEDPVPPMKVVEDNAAPRNELGEHVPPMNPVEVAPQAATPPVVHSVQADGPSFGAGAPVEAVETATHAAASDAIKAKLQRYLELKKLVAV